MYFRMNVYVHLPIVLDCRYVLIYVGRKVAHTFNIVNTNQNGHHVVAIMRIDNLVLHSVL